MTNALLVPISGIKNVPKRERDDHTWTLLYTNPSDHDQAIVEVYCPNQGDGQLNRSVVGVRRAAAPTEPVEQVWGGLPRTGQDAQSKGRLLLSSGYVLHKGDELVFWTQDDAGDVVWTGVRLYR